MRRKKRTEITVEIRQLVIRHQTNPSPAWCPECSSPLQSVTPEVAAELAGVDTLTIYRWAEAGQIHFIKTTGQSPLICLNSLLGSTDKGEKNHDT